MLRHHRLHRTEPAFLKWDLGEAPRRSCTCAVGNDPEHEPRGVHDDFARPIQTWMALPEEQEESEPAFVHHGSDDLPAVNVDGIRARVIAGEAFGTRSPLKTPSETLYADVHLAAGAQLPIDPSYEERALYTIAGEIEVAGDVFGPGQLLVLRCGDAIRVRATADAQFMLFGGAPMGGPRYIWWNFVSSRPERIEQAKEEWARGRFDTVPGDMEEFIPLPQTQEKPRRATGAVFYP